MVEIIDSMEIINEMYYIYNFQWYDGNCLVAINTPNRDELINLLDNYKDIEENYNIDEWVEYLEDKDYKVKYIDEYEVIEF